MEEIKELNAQAASEILLNKLDAKINDDIVTLSTEPDHYNTETEVKSIVPLKAYHYHPPYNRLRRAKLILFGNVLSEYSKFNDSTYDERLKIIDAIEKSCKNQTIEKAQETNIVATWVNDLFCELYNGVCYRVSSNLEKNGLVANPTFANDMLNDKQSLNNIANLTSVEMYPDRYEIIRKRIQLSKEIEQTMKTTSLYTCGKCFEKKCTYENLYNRSLDEGVNLKLTCVNCGHEFRA